MKIIVTGGAGFIGSNFVSYWNKKHKNDDVIVVDKLTYSSNTAYLKDLNYTLIKNDIVNTKEMLKVSKDADVIINFAAETHVDNSIKNADKFVSSNILGVYSLLKVVMTTGIRMHHVSTDEVYGALPLKGKNKFTETSSYAPRNPYSATKAGADLLIKAFCNTYKLPITISNCSNNFGPNQHPEKLVPKAIMHAINSIPIPIYGNGKQIRDWIFAYDHVSAIDTIIRKGEFGETYLVSANNEIENIELVRRILKILGKPQSLIKFVKDRPGHDARYALDSKKTRSLGWEPEFTLDKGIKLTIKHYLDNQKLYAGKIS